MGVESYYAWRALPSLKAKLALGEDSSDPIFLMVLTMLVAVSVLTSNVASQSARLRARHFRRGTHTAKVTVSQMGRVIYETQVPVDRFVFRILVILSPVRCIFA